MQESTVQILTVVGVILIIATKLLARKHRYFASGLILVLLGVAGILYEVGESPFDISQFLVVQFAAYILVGFAGKDLLKEALKERSGFVKHASIALGILLLAITTIPILNEVGVNAVVLPSYPKAYDYLIYILSGVFLWIGIFTLLKRGGE